MLRVVCFAANLLTEMIGLSSARGRLLLTVALLGLLRTLSPDQIEKGPPLCLITRVIGRPCPACGMTRAACSIVHGNMRRAAGYNRAIFVVAGLVAILTSLDVREIYRKSRSAQP